MNVYDERGRELVSAKLKNNTLNVTLARQTLIDIIQSYVKSSSIYTNHLVTGLEQTNSKVTVHFSAQESEAFDLVYRSRWHSLKCKGSCWCLYQVDLSGLYLL